MICFLVGVIGFIVIALLLYGLGILAKVILPKFVFDDEEEFSPIVINLLRGFTCAFVVFAGFCIVLGAVITTHELGCSIMRHI